MDFHWLYQGTEGPRLRFTITNIGHAVGAISGLVFQPEAEGEPVTDSGWTPGDLDEALPITLGVGQITPVLWPSRFPLAGREAWLDHPSDDYSDGKGRLVLVGPRQFKKDYAIPPL